MTTLNPLLDVLTTISITLIVGIGLGFLLSFLLILNPKNNRHQKKIQVMNTDFNNLMSTLKEKLVAVETQSEGLKIRIGERDDNISHQAFKYQTLQSEYTQLRSEYTQLKTTHQEKIKSFREQEATFEKTREQLKLEFNHLANKILEEKGNTFKQNSQNSLEALLKPFREQIEGFQKRVNEVHSDTIKGNSSLESEIKKIVDIGISMSKEANTLASALKGDKKMSGNWGEMQLQQALELAGLIKNEHYESQAHFKDKQNKSYYPDFIIKLPANKQLIIDSKVSLIDYNHAISSDTELDQNNALKAHIKAVKNHMDNLSKKDYTNLIGMHSPTFVLMFMAVEPAYIAAMQADKDLFNYGYHKNVIFVSYTTLMPILRTVANLWMMESSQKEAKQISEKAGDIYNQVCQLAEHIYKLGNTFNTASSHYNKAIKALVGRQGLHGKIEKFNQLSTKINKTMPELTTLETDFEHQSLELLVEPLALALDKETSKYASDSSNSTTLKKETSAPSI